MAPKKKRTTTKNSRAKRIKPKLPEGNFNTSLDAEEEESKLNNYIQDFQLQVNTKLEKMRKHKETLKGLVTNCYRNGMIEILKSVREMTMEEFFTRGGAVDAVISSQVNTTINCLIEDPATAPVLGGVPSTIRLPLANVSNNIDITVSSLDQSSTMSQSTSSVQTAGKSTRKRKQAKTTENKPPLPPPSGTRSSRRLQAKTTNNEVTPMPNMNTFSVLNKAAFVTPKFDPSLPIPSTIMIREPKAGERIMSMGGSPLANPAGLGGRSAPQLFIPLTGGMTMQLRVDDKNDQEIDVANDSVAQQNIRLLQEKLSKLLIMPTVME